MSQHAEIPSVPGVGIPTAPARGRQPFLRGPAYRLLASRMGRYMVALLSVLVALLLQRSLSRLIPLPPFLLFHGAIMVAGWWGGWGPGLTALGLSMAAANYYFQPPFEAFELSLKNAVPLGLFALLGLLVTWLNVTLRQAHAERARLLERERAALAEAERERSRLRDFLGQAPAYISLFQGSDHVYTFSNVLTVTLLAHRELLGRPLREAVPEAESQGIIALLDRVYATGEPFHTHAMPLYFAQPDGSRQERFLNFVIQPLKEASGRVEGIATVGFDVTDLVLARQRAESLAAELRLAESRARLLAESGAVLVSSLDYEATLRNVARLAVPALADWCFVDLAEAEGTFRRVEAAHAFPEDAALAREALGLSLAPPGDRLPPPIGTLLQGRTVLIEELNPRHLRAAAQDEAHERLMHAAGLVSFIAVPMVMRGQVLGVLSFFTSRSGRRLTQAEVALLKELSDRAALSVENARLYREAREAIRLRDEFLSIASHELKTPLTPLSLKLQSLARNLERHPGSIPREVVEGYVEMGRRQVQKLSELVGDLLDVSRIAAGRLTLDLEDVNLGALVQEVVGRYELQATRAGSQLSVEGSEAAITGRWDRLRLEQVITNLVDNAVKYGAGRPIHVRLAAEPRCARLQVRDEGIGIAPEHLPRLFGRFERAVSERNYGGLGLGLYITRTLVEAMGGRVHVESAPGKGSTFTVELPQDAGEPEAAASPA